LNINLRALQFDENQGKQLN